MTPEIDPDTEPDAVIEIDTESDTPDVDAGDTVVIVDTTDDGESDDDAVDAVVIATELDIVERVTRLEERVMTIDQTAWEAKFAAENAMDAVDELAEVDEEIIDAVDENFEALEDAEIDDVDDDGEDELVVDSEPVSQKVHPLFRSRADWGNR